jgi:hypothetical protein
MREVLDWTRGHISEIQPCFSCSLSLLGKELKIDLGGFLLPPFLSPSLYVKGWRRQDCPCAYLIKHYAMKTYKGVEVHINNPDLDTEWMRMVTFKPLSHYPRRKSPWYPLDRGLGGPQSRSGRCGLEKNLMPLPGIEPGQPARSPSLYRLSYPSSWYSIEAYKPLAGQRSRNG